MFVYSVIVISELYNCLKGFGKRVLWEVYVVQVPTQVIPEWLEGWSFVKNI